MSTSKAWTVAVVLLAASACGAPSKPGEPGGSAGSGNETDGGCELCTDGRLLVDGECRCPAWNCVVRGGAAYCAAEDQSEPNDVSCDYDGVTTCD